MRKHLQRLKNILKLRDRTWHFDIHPDRALAFFTRHERVFGWGIFISVIALIFAGTFSTRASVARFYPERCLGGWENPQGARGIPDVASTFSTEEAVSAALGVLTYDREEYEHELAESELTRRKLTEFNRQNSAVLENSAADIFCGDFKGEIPVDALPQKFVLNFSWEMKEPILEEGLNPPDGESAEPTIDTLLDQPVPEEIIVPAPMEAEPVPEIPQVGPVEEEVAPETAPEPPAEPVSFLNNLWATVFAQEETPAPESAPPAEEFIPATNEPMPEPASEPALEEPLPPTPLSIFEKMERGAEGGEVIPPPVEEKVEEIIEEVKEIIEQVEIPQVRPVGDGFLEILMSLDGANWETIGQVNRSNWKNLEIEIPPEKIGGWEQIDKLQINLRPAFSVDVPPAVYLDAMWLEVSYIKESKPEVELTPEEIEKAEKIELDPEKIFLDSPKSFRAGESWEFEINTEVTPEALEVPQVPQVGIVEEEKKAENPIINFFFKKVFAQNQKVKVLKTEIFNNDGEKMASDITVQEMDGKIRLITPEPPTRFRPGRYEIKIDLLIDGKLYSSTQGFLWGVLAINVNKSIYLPGENAYLQMAVLDDDGHTVCGADLKLEITEPSGMITEFSGALGTIISSPTCGPDNVTDDPDYFARYDVGLAGVYKMRLTNLGNNYEINDSFEVRDSVPFEVERIGATRINPFKARYVMTLKIKANQDFDGEIIESAPESFEITPNSAFRTEVLGSSEKIIWNKKLSAGESATLKYEYQGPLISPEFFLLGPAVFNENNLEIFEEARRWQIASDQVSCSNLTTSFDTGNSDYTTASIDPAQNELILAIIVTSDTGSADIPTNITGNSLTWVNVNSTLFASSLRGISMFRAMNTTSDPPAGAVTISGFADAQTGGAWSIIKCTSTDLSGTNGSGAVVQSNVNTGSGMALSATLGAFGSADNGTVAGWGIDLNDTDISPEAGLWAELGNTGHNSPAQTVESEWVNSNDTSPSATSSTGDWGGVAAEIKAATITVSGTSNAPNGTSVRLAVNSTLNGTTTTVDGAGNWSFTSNIPQPASGDVITVWLDGVLAGSGSTAVTGYSGSGNATGMVLTVGTLSIGSSQDRSVTVTNLGQYDNDNDTDIMHTANLGVFNVDDDGDFASDIINVLSGDTLTINGAGTESMTADDVKIDGTLTCSGACAIRVAGYWDNNSVFNEGTGTVNFTASSGTETIDNTGASTHAFYNLTMGKTSGTATWTMSSAIDVDNILAIDYGTLSNGANAITLAGNLSIGASGLYTAGAGTFTFDTTASSTWTDASAIQNMGTVIIDGTTKTVTLASSAKATKLNIGADDTFSLASSGYTFTLTGSGTGLSRPFINNNTLTAGSDSTFKFTGLTDSDIQNATYDNLTLAPSGGSNPTYALMAGTIATDNFIIGDGSNAVTIDWNTNDPTLNVAGNFTLSASATWTKSTTATLNLRPRGTKTWTDSNSTKQDVGAVSVANGSVTPTINLGSSVSATSLTIDISHEFSHNGANTLTLTGATGSPLTNSGTFTASTGTVVFNGNGSLTIAAVTYNNLTFNPVLTVGVGNIVYTGGGATVIGGTWSVNPSGSANSLTYTFGGDVTGGPALTITRTGVSATSIVNTSGSNYALTATSIDIQTGGTLTANGSTITVSGTGSPFTATGTFNYNTSAFQYTGGGATTIIATTYYTLRVLPGAISATHTFSAGTFNIENNLDLGGNGNSTGTVVDAGANDPTINVKGNLTVCMAVCSNQMTYTKPPTRTLTLKPTGTKTWTDNNPTTKQDMGIVSVSGGASTPRINLGSSVSATSLGITAGHIFSHNGSNTLTLTGASASPLSNSGTFTASTGTVVFNGNGSITIATVTYNNLTFSPTLTVGVGDITYTAGGATAVGGALSVNPSGSANRLTYLLGGALTGNPTITITRTGANVTSVLDTEINNNYPITATRVDIQTGGTLEANVSEIFLTGTSGTLFTRTGSFSAGTSTVRMNPDADVTLTSGAFTGANAFSGLDLSPAITADRVYTFGSGAIEATGSLTISPMDICVLCFPAPILTVNMGASITESGTGIIIGGGDADTVLNTTALSSYALTGSAITVGASGTLTGNASTIDSNGAVAISSGGTLTSTSGTFTIAGDYTNSGTFTHSNGLVTLDGAVKQTLAGTMTGAGAFYDLTITNASGASPSDCERTGFTPSVDFNAAATATNNYTITTSNVRVEYNSGSTYTFTNINWVGTAGNLIYFRNSAVTGTWLLNVSGTQTVSYVNVSRSDASGGNAINATDGTNTNCNNNTNWNFGSAPTITFDMDIGLTEADPGETAAPYTVALGTIDTSTVRRSGNTQSIGSVWIDLATNGTGGVVVTVLSSNASLKSTSVSGDTIPSATATMSAGTANYGLCVASVAQTSGGPLAKVSPYNGATCADGAVNNVGLVDGTSRNILNSSSVAITGGRGRIRVNSAVSGVTPAHNDYTDTLTFIATGTF